VATLTVVAQFSWHECREFRDQDSNSSVEPMGVCVVRKAGGYVFNTIAIVFVIAVVLILILTRFDWRVDCVVSDSMEPKIGRGSFVITRPVRTQEIGVGDVIVFRHTVFGEQASQMLIIHRVTDTGDGTWFQTKGDANEEPDAFVIPYQDVLGQVCFHLPYWGRVLQTAKTPFGIAVLVCCFGLLIVSDGIDIRRQTLTRKKTRSAACRAAKERPNSCADRGTRRT
jgi:signal peptidase I